MDDLLYDLYYNKHNYDGAETLFKKAKEINNNIKRDEVKEWLKRQATNQMNYSTVKIKKQLPKKECFSLIMKSCENPTIYSCSDPQ